MGGAIQAGNGTFTCRQHYTGRATQPPSVSTAVGGFEPDDDEGVTRETPTASCRCRYEFRRRTTQRQAENTHKEHSQLPFPQ